MKHATIKYFHDASELVRVHAVDQAQYVAIGGKPPQGDLFDGFGLMAGYLPTDPSNPRPVTRAVKFTLAKHPRKCDARCMGAKGHNCECACGGRNHGMNG